MNIKLKLVSISQVTLFVYVVFLLFSSAFHAERIVQLLGIFLIIWTLSTRKVIVSRKVKNVIVIFFALIAYCFAIVLLHPNATTYYPFLFINQMIVYLAFALKRYSKDQKATIFNMITAVCMINVVISILQFFNVFGLRSTFGFLLNDRVRRTVESGLVSRANGLNTGFDINGVLCAVTCELLVTKLKGQEQKKNRVFLIIGIGMSAVATVISSRVGIVALLLVVLLNVPKERRLRYILLCLAVAILFLTFFMNKPLVYSIFKEHNEVLVLYEYLAELVNNIIHNEGFRTDSTDVLLEFYFLPESISQFLFGDGVANHLRVTGFSDVGYVQMIFGIGICGSLLYLIELFQMAKIRINNKQTPYAHTIWVIAVILIVTTLKGSYLLTSPVLNMFMILCAINESEVIR